MNRTNLTVGLLFLVLGIYLAASSFWLPSGVGPLPGPGFFPGAIGALIILLAAALLAQAVKQPAGTGLQIGNRRAIAGAVGLTLLYLLLWGTGGFAPRTAVFLVVLLKFLGERWKPALVVALVLTATVTLAFRFGLRLTLE